MKVDNPQPPPIELKPLPPTAPPEVVPYPRVYLEGGHIILESEIVVQLKRIADCLEARGQNINRKGIKDGYSGGNENVENI